MGPGVLQQSHDLRSDDGVDGIERAEQHDVVGLDVGVNKVELVVGMVLIEDVFGVVALIEKRQGDGRLRVGGHIHVVGVDTVFAQKPDDMLAHAVVAGLANKRGVDAATAQ